MLDGNITLSCSKEDIVVALGSAQPCTAPVRLRRFPAARRLFSGVKSTRALTENEDSMRRSGTVAVINSDRAMVALATEDDGFTIIELLSDWDIEVGDSIALSNGHGLGDEIL
jgi:hypothetical protein